MTTLNSATVNSVTINCVTGRIGRRHFSSGFAKPFKAVLAVSLAAFALAGCESGSNLLAQGGNSGPQTAIAPQPPSNAQLAKIEIAPVIGAPDNVSRDLQTQLTASMERSRISVAKAPGGKGEYTLRGYIVAAREKTGSKISYIWDVTDQTGKRANRITGEEFAAGTGKDPWSTVTPQIVQSIADKTAAQIASWLPGNAPAANVPVANAPAAVAPDAQKVATAAATAATPAVANATLPATPAALTTAAATPPAAAASTTGSIDNGATIATLVPQVTGAPGDGSATLTSAIQRELTKNGVALTGTPGAQTYKVEGKVAMGQGKDGKQPIQIDWNVIDPKGKKLGTVSQKNEVPQGSLDGAWGKTADAAAAAAAQGILKLLPQSKAN